MQSIEEEIKGLIQFYCVDGEWVATLSTNDREEYKLNCPHCKKQLVITQIIKACPSAVDLIR